MVVESSQAVQDQEALAAENWRTRKPQLFVQPGSWLKRKLRLKLNDMLEPIGLKVTDNVGFHCLPRYSHARHIIDVGVADGTPSLYEAYPTAYLDLFEPAEKYVPNIEKSILRHRQGRLHRCALGSAEAHLPLVRAGRSSGCLDPHARTRGLPEEEFSLVPVRRLDAILRPDDIRGPAVLKIDTEGFELDVLAGAENLLPSIELVVVEMQLHKNDRYSPDELVSFLKARSFLLAGVLGHEIIEGAVYCSDFVFQRA